ncbi:hypothetical protein LOC68_03045 [Blastopirellula sp. JC732]|uniref:Carboxypeptidase regulatory-like domain-containing protein n=1 Tax=Blastopirellula sediminis TaxID=2894196 RepID=A0A9X1MIU2_9BACT|nr:hypothetical protein [Blastopirellula sediminis]MCC9607846.1 hypothetical protein [Blastopirellula sediminis]MCC9627361.1 hypothetical protein [Blastopirellula sediminis]
MFQLWKIGASLAVIAMAGCSDSGPLRFPVEGTLMLDGQPVPFKSLTLVPTDGTMGHGASGFSDAEGKFNLQAIVPGAVRDYRGCPPGKYQVVISEPLIPVSESISQEAIQGEAIGEEGPAAAMAMVMPTRRRAKRDGDIPLHYTSERTSPLVVEVAEGIESYELVMLSKR